MLSMSVSDVLPLRPQGGAEWPSLAARGPGGDPLRLLLMPGAAGAGIDHWLTQLQREYPGSLRVKGGRNRSVELVDWTRRLDDTLAGAPQGRWLAIAEDTAGLVLLRHLRRHADTPVAAALLVSLPDPARTGEAALMSHQRLPLPCALAPLAGDADAPAVAVWATRWGARILGNGRAPHETVLPMAQAWIAGMSLRLAPPPAPTPEMPAPPSAAHYWINT